MIGEKLKLLLTKGIRKNCRPQHDNLALLRREHGVAHEEENDKELENYLRFCHFTHFFEVSHLFVN